jgi:1-deoxy-D-xylulose-5-phosphate synthase
MKFDIKNSNIKELEQIAYKIRTKILNTISQKGGHFSSPLGAVELIIGMHKVFNVKTEPFIFDVSHQAYAHKLLTNRWDNFDSIRSFDGISGFTNPNESKYDCFISGHSSTSISLGVGCAKAFRLKKQNYIPVVMIGDGSMSAGMVYEALNELGDLKLPLVIILNDNEMSISKPIGAISKYLSKMLAGALYQGVRKKVDFVLKRYFSKTFIYLAQKFEESFKLITPGILFEELGVDYIGPIDGHNLKEIVNVLQMAKNLNRPVIVHAKTTKGKGYKIAEGNFEDWHGVGAFDLKSGEPIVSSIKAKEMAKKNAKITKQEKENNTTKTDATSVYSNALLDLATKYKNVVGVTAAMPVGTGLDKLMRAYPNRFWDVSISEQHAVTSMGAMAKEGFKPFITIYSTFLQRAYDQIIHDIAISNLNVVFAIDRAGIVGNDGETHQGAFDISYLRALPNIILFAPSSKEGLIDCVKFAYDIVGACAFRYPRGSFLELPFKHTKFSLGKSIWLQKHKISNDNNMITTKKSKISLVNNKIKAKIAFIGYCKGVELAWQTNELLGGNFNLIDLRFIKPLDRNFLISLAKKCDKWFIFSNSAKMGGTGSALMEFANENKLNIQIISFEYNDNFITHGETSLVEKSLGLDAKSIADKIKNKYL